MNNFVKMPFDTKRINGPEVSFDYKKFAKSKKSQTISEKYRRSKERKTDDEHRKICKFNLQSFKFFTKLQIFQF